MDCSGDSLSEVWRQSDAEWLERAWLLICLEGNAVLMYPCACRYECDWGKPQDCHQARWVCPQYRPEGCLRLKDEEAENGDTQEDQEDYSELSELRT